MRTNAVIEVTDRGMVSIATRHGKVEMNIHPLDPARVEVRFVSEGIDAKDVETRAPLLVTELVRMFRRMCGGR